MKYSGLTMVGFVSIMLLMSTVIFADDGQVELHGVAECPSSSDLNATTLHWHMKWENSVFLSEDYAASRVNAGLQRQYSEKDFEELSGDEFQAVCTALNERFRDRWLMAVTDREIKRQVPETYSIYYRVGDHYVVISAVYSPGDPELDKIGLPSGGGVGVRVFDLDLNEVGSFSF